MRTCLIALLAAPSVAWGQACPTSADTGPRIPNGTRVTVLEISRDDSYASERALIGKEGTATDLVNSDQTCWYGGEVRFDDGTSRYFYRVAVDAGNTSGEWPSCDPAALMPPVPSGTQTMVLAVHPDDSYYGNPLLAPGTVVTTTGQMTAMDDCWMSGSIRTPDGGEFYTYKVSLGSDENLCPANAIRSAPQAGERLQVVRVHRDSPESEHDVFSDGIAVEAVGKMGIEDSCWLAGDLLIPSEGRTLSATRIALARGSGATTTCSGSSTPRVGDTVTVASIGTSDPYAAVAHRVVGVQGTIRAVSAESNSCWTSGELEATNGVRYRFGQATFRPVSTEE